MSELTKKYFNKIEHLAVVREDVYKDYSHKIRQGANANALFNNFALQANSKRYLAPALEGVAL